MNPAWPSALLLLTAWTARADDTDQLRVLVGSVFTKGVVVAEINLNHTENSDEDRERVV